jgi:hypothetical protein
MFDSDLGLDFPHIYHPSPGGGIGRRNGLKIRRGQPLAGSIPAPGTTLKELIATLLISRLGVACRVWILS